MSRLWRVVNNVELARSPLLLSFLELSEAVRVIPQQQPSPSRTTSIAQPQAPAVSTLHTPISCRSPSPCILQTVCMTQACGVRPRHNVSFGMAWHGQWGSQLPVV